MNEKELEKEILIYRYNELKKIVKPIINQKDLLKIFNQELEKYDNETIKKIIISTLNKIGNIVSSGVFLVILLNYKDLIEPNDPIKVMNLSKRTKKITIF